jgi:hypothetical protein
MRKKEWFNMTVEERNKLLGQIGGCPGCSHWIPAETGFARLRDRCVEPTGFAKELYDNGCICHSNLNVDLKRRE